MASTVQYPYQHSDEHPADERVTDVSAVGYRQFLVAATGFVAAAWLAVAPIPAIAQAYPSKPIAVVVPYAGGGQLDNTIRTTAAAVEKTLGQSILIDNRPGAGGLIGANYVAKQAAADGHTLLFTVASLATYPALNRNLGFDPLKDLAPVSILYEQPYLFVTNNQVPAKTLKEFIAYAKANPGKMNYGSSGRSITMLATESFLNHVGIQVTQVPFSNLALITTALMRNDIQLYTPGVSSASGQIKSGVLVPLFVTGSTRLVALPDVPTSAEAGVPNFTATVWAGFFAPALTPAGIVDKFSAAIKAAVADPATRDVLIKRDGITPVGSTPAEAGKIMRDSVSEFSAIAKKLGLQPE
jgi:tripartite-type tricarboxylate transporter receptor subunit TctC